MNPRNPLPLEYARKPRGRTLRDPINIIVDLGLMLLLTVVAVNLIFSFVG
jgi:hypothetical protein